MNTSLSNKPLLRISGFTLLLIFLLNPAFAIAQTGAQTASQTDILEEEPKALELVTVTGSRIKRIDMEGPAQVITFTNEDMSASGYTTVFEALSDLAINSGWNAEGPERSNGFTPDAQTLNLRVAGPGSTLTLINVISGDIRGHDIRGQFTQMALSKHIRGQFTQMALSKLSPECPWISNHEVTR